MTQGDYGPFLRQTLPMTVKWILIIVLIGGSMCGGAMGWTYHYSNKTMNWIKTREWCLTKYTDMVAIQNQEENDYLVSLLPNRTQSPYYWIGIHKTDTGNWTWIGNNGTWVGNTSWAPNEPNNVKNEYCVEIIINTSTNRGKWNDEPCNREKSPVCYRVQCNQTSCNSHGKCLETINNITCLCDPGFEGHRCQTAVTCGEPITPQNGRVSCSGLHGNISFASSCNFLCLEDSKLSGPTEVRCNSSGMWDPKEPLCKAMECASLSELDDGSLNCSGGKHTFNSTCRFRCAAEFLLLGPREITCGRDGAWSGPRPVCAGYKHLLMALCGGGVLSAPCYICFCFTHCRKRKKLAQPREPEDGGTQSNDTRDG